MRLTRFALVVFLAVASTADAGVFRLLDDDRDSAQARIDLFQQATTQINALYFLARNDRITLAALSVLCEARRRGVQTRLIVDANFHHIPKPILGYLRDQGVEIKVYHPLTLRHPLWLFYRMHEKVVIVDGKRYITGGRNLAESYFGLAKKNYVDRDVYVDDPESAADADRHFENLWTSRHVADLSMRVSARDKAGAEVLLSNALAAMQKKEFIRLDTNYDWSAEQPNVASIEFLHDPVGAGPGPRVGTRLTEVLEKANESIVLESPYFVPSRSLIRLIEAKRKEGVSVMVVTNSLTSNDGFLPHVAYLKYRRHLVRAGVDVREYKGPHCLHAKSAVVDGRIALVGSYNIDPRSENLNTEVMAVADDEGAARALLASIEAHAAHSYKIGTRRQRGAWPNRVTSFKMWVTRLFLPLVEGQL